MFNSAIIWELPLARYRKVRASLSAGRISALTELLHLLWIRYGLIYSKEEGSAYSYLANIAKYFEYLCQKRVKSLPTYSEVSKMVIWVIKPHLLQKIAIFSLFPTVRKDKLNLTPPFPFSLLPPGQGKNEITFTFAA